MHEVCEAAAVVLGACGPTHYKVLAEVMVSEGLWRPRGRTAPPDMLYFQLHKDIRGGGTTFTLFGKGVFGLAGQEAPGDLSSLTPGRRSAPPDLDKATPRRSRRAADKVAPEDRTCGGCAHVEFTGVKEATLAGGECSIYDTSGRITVSYTEMACPAWRPRPESKVRAEQKRSRDLLVIVAGVNACAHAGKIWTTKFSEAGKRAAKAAGQ